MDEIMKSTVMIIVAVFASQGFWSYIQRKDVRKGAQTRLLLGIAHDRIIHLGTNYIERGWITNDEYEDFVNYLWGPYSEFGGNGLAEKVVKEVEKLPFRGKRHVKVEEPPHEQQKATFDRRNL